MKKLLPILVFVFCLLVSPVAVSAQGFKLPSSEVGTDKFNASSPFYFFKSLRENIGLIFARSTEAKLDSEIKLAKTRLAEINALAGGKAEDKIVKTIASFQINIDSMVNLKDADQSKILETMGTHLGSLERIYVKVKNADAKAAIAKTIERENNLIQPILTGMSPANRRSAERLVLFRQASAVRFLKKEATSSSLPQDYANLLKQKFEVKQPIRR